MIASIQYRHTAYSIDLSNPKDLSIAVTGKGKNRLNAWGISPPEIAPHEEGGMVGSVARGASVNFNNIRFNPHSHITHTECLGHITEQPVSVNKVLARYFFMAKLVTIAPEKYRGDFVISRKQLEYALGDSLCEAVIIRTLPNTRRKRTRDYSNTNPPYVLEETARLLADRKVNHLLVDLPSVDKEDDGGALLAHKAFWGIEGELRKEATITELIYVDNSIKDGMYFLDLQTAPFENDAVPSRPVLYGIIN